MRKLLLTAFALSLAVPALAAQQDIAQLSAVTASREALRTAINTQLSAVQSNFDEVYAAIGTRPWVIQATAPADTTLAWFDTDQVVDAVVLKIHNGERWVPQAIGEGGSYTLPTAAADTLGGVKVGARLTITDGVLSADVQTPSGSATYPSAAGVANWGGSAWGTSYTVGTAANNLVQLNASEQLPAVSGALLTGSFTGTIIGSQTTIVGGLQTIATELDGQDELLFDADDFTETAGTKPDGTRTVTVSIKKTEYIGWSVVNSDTATAVADGKMGATIPAGMNGMNLTDVTCSVAALNAASSGATTAVIRRVRLGSRMGDDTSQFDLTFSTPNVTVTWDATGTDPGISTSTLAAGDEVDISGFATAANNGHFTVATVGANYFTFANASGVENLNDTGVTITPIRHRDMTSTGVTIECGDYTASDEVIDTSNDDLATGDNLYVDINAVTTPAHKGLHCTATFEAP